MDAIAAYVSTHNFLTKASKEEACQPFRTRSKPLKIAVKLAHF